MCAGVGLSGGREGQACSPTCTGPVLAHFECRGAPARVRVWRCEGRPPLPHQPPLCVCVWRNLPYLTYLPSTTRTRNSSRAPPSVHCGDAQNINQQCTGQRRTLDKNLPAELPLADWHCPLGHHPRRRDAILGAAADGAAGTDSVVAGRGVGRRRMARRGRSKTPNTSEPEPSIAQKNKDVYNAASAPTREPTREPGSGACCDEARYRQGRAIHDSRGEPTPQTGDRSRAESTC